LPQLQPTRITIDLSNSIPSYAHAIAVSRQASAAKPPTLPAWRFASVRHPHGRTCDIAGRTRCPRVFDSRIFGAILRQGTGSVKKAGLAAHDLAGAAVTESGLLAATDAKARVGGSSL
jgi:hypothetical protein